MTQPERLEALERATKHAADIAEAIQKLTFQIRQLEREKTAATVPIQPQRRDFDFREKPVTSYMRARSVYDQAVANQRSRDERRKQLRAQRSMWEKRKGDADEDIARLTPEQPSVAMVQSAALSALPSPDEAVLHQ